MNWALWLLPLLFRGVFSDEFCGKDAVLEFVLVQDYSGSYASFVSGLQRTIMPQLLAALEAKFPGSRYGLTAFSDYTERGQSNDFCYVFHQALTTSTTDFMANLNTIRIGWGGDVPETSLMGAALSALEPRMGWSSGSSSGSKRIVRVIALTTDAPSHLPRLTTRPAFTGKVGDSCNNDVPSLAQVGEVLRERNISFLGLIARAAIPTWEGYLRDMGGQGAIHLLDPSAVNDMVATIEKGIEDVVCTTAPPPASTTAPTATTTAAVTTVTGGTGSEGVTTATEEEKGGVSPGPIIGAAVGGVAALGAIGAGAYAYSNFSNATPTIEESYFEQEGEPDADQDREAAANVEMSEFA